VTAWFFGARPAWYLSPISTLPRRLGTDPSTDEPGIFTMQRTTPDPQQLSRFPPRVGTGSGSPDASDLRATLPSTQRSECASPAFKSGSQINRSTSVKKSAPARVPRVRSPSTTSWAGRRDFYRSSTFTPRRIRVGLGPLVDPQ
jgi:hypothetical protein